MVLLFLQVELSQQSGAIQGPFRGHSGAIQGPYSLHKGPVWVTTGREGVCLTSRSQASAALACERALAG